MSVNDVGVLNPFKLSVVWHSRIVDVGQITAGAIYNHYLSNISVYQQ